jgi:hypothetical protein
MRFSGRDLCGLDSLCAGCCVGSLQQNLVDSEIEVLVKERDAESRCSAVLQKDGAELIEARLILFGERLHSIDVG